MRYLLLTALATVLICGGCSDGSSGDLDAGTSDTDTDTDTDTDVDTDTDTDTDTGPDCTLGEYSGHLVIETQSDVATLAGYTSISEWLYIFCPSCTDLSELICLTSVGRHLNIWKNDALTSLDGLSNVTSVSGSLSIAENDALTNLDELSGITSLGESLQIFWNTGLTNIDGLSGITSVGGGFLKIDANYALTNLDGLNNVTSVGWYLEIISNNALPDCEVCDLLDQLTYGPTSTSVNNLVDTCSPVPDNCP